MDAKKILSFPVLYFYIDFNEKNRKFLSKRENAIKNTFFFGRGKVDSGVFDLSEGKGDITKKTLKEN